jgi:hypothetical protein
MSLLFCERKPLLFCHYIRQEDIMCENGYGCENEIRKNCYIFLYEAVRKKAVMIFF